MSKHIKWVHYQGEDSNSAGKDTNIIEDIEESEVKAINNLATPETEKKDNEVDKSETSTLANWYLKVP